MSQSDIAGSVAALVLAGGSSDNPLARDRAMPALEIGEALGMAWYRCHGVLQTERHTVVHEHAALNPSLKRLAPHGTNSAEHGVVSGTGSNLRLIDIPISNCIRSGVNKM